MVIHSAESCVGLGTKEGGGDWLNRKELLLLLLLPQRERGGVACAIAHKNSDRTHFIFREMAEEGDRSILSNFSAKVQ